MLDESYRKAGKMDKECFSSMLDPFHTNLIKIIRGYHLEGFNSTTCIKAELYKLNVYSKYLIFVHPYLVLCWCPGKGSFFKPHVDTPRSEKMFGSLVVVFPTPHEGGALFLRHHGQEWIFDSAQALAGVEQPTIGYVAFFGDVEHEVAPVTSGHRITLTYNLYFNDAVSEHLISPQPPNQEEFREAFNALLGDPEFMADGSTLGFRLRHVYPIKESLEHVYNVLKGSDAVVYQSMRVLGFEPVLYVYYDEAEDDDGDDDGPKSAMVNKLIDFDCICEDETVVDAVQDEGGILVREAGVEMQDDPDSMDAEPVTFVTPMTTYNRQGDAFASYGNEPMLNWAYGDVCMIVRIGKAGDRLTYPTVAQVGKAYRERWSERRSRYYG